MISLEKGKLTLFLSPTQGLAKILNLWSKLNGEDRHTLEATHLKQDSIYRDPSGNFLVLNIKYETSLITISCIYGSNSDDPDFYNNIVFPKTQECHEHTDYTIMGGDWNLSLN